MAQVNEKEQDGIKMIVKVPFKLHKFISNLKTDRKEEGFTNETLAELLIMLAEEGKKKFSK